MVNRCVRGGRAGRILLTEYPTDPDGRTEKCNNGNVRSKALSTSRAAAATAVLLLLAVLLQRLRIWWLLTRFATRTLVLEAALAFSQLGARADAAVRAGSRSAVCEVARGTPTTGTYGLLRPASCRLLRCAVSPPAARRTPQCVVARCRQCATTALSRPPLVAEGTMRTLPHCHTPAVHPKTSVGGPREDAVTQRLSHNPRSDHTSLLVFINCVLGTHSVATRWAEGGH